MQDHSFITPLKLKKHRYHNRRFSSTLKFMNSKTGILFDKDLFWCFRDAGFDLDVSRDNKSVYEPQQLFDRLSGYDGPRNHRSEIDFSEVYSNVISRAFSTFGGSHDLDINLDRGEVSKNVLMEKASGAPLFTSKGEAFERDYTRALKIINGEESFPPCTAYHRVQHGNEGPKTRLVWGFPLSVTIIESCLARPIIEVFLKKRCPIAFGLRKMELASRLLPISNRYFRYGMDFSKFDSTVPQYIIKVAFKILKSHFKKNEETDRLFEICERYFTDTPIVMPDGYVYVKNRGIPSGSYFTQLIGSIVNYIVTNVTYEVVTGMKINDDCMLFLGDDSLIGVSKEMDLSLYSSVCKQLFGMNVSAEKSHSSIGPHASVDFLGHHWDHGIIDRDLDDSIRRLIFSEKPKRVDNYREYMRSKLYSLVADSKSAWSMLFTIKSIQRNDLQHYFELRQILDEDIKSGYSEGQPRMKTTGFKPRSSYAAAAYLHILL